MSFPSDIVRTKNWGNEVLTDSDLEGQFDLIINWLDAFADESTGHDHTGGSNKGIKIALATSVSGTLPTTNGGTGLTTYTQGDVPYSSASNTLAKLAAGTSGYFLKTLGAAANPLWAQTPQLKIGSFTRDASTASGTQAVTGVGFLPRLVILLQASSTAINAWSVGLDDGTTHQALYIDDITQHGQTSTNHSIHSEYSSGSDTAYVSTLGSDGFTLTWTKSSSPTGTLTILYLAIA